MNITTSPHFNSFVWAGFECTYALADYKKRLDMLSLTRHDTFCYEDYVLIKEKGIKTVREGLSWSSIDKGNGVYDFERFEHMMQVGSKLLIQQIWDLNHFDFPERLDPYSEQFISAFAEYAKRVIEVLRKYYDDTLYIVPLNEISFFAWIGADVGYWAPYKKGIKNSVAFKKQLVKASIAAQKAMKKEDSNVRFIHVDPFMIRSPKEPSRPSIRNFALDFNNNVRYEAWDMIAGRKNPELGGEENLLDIIGINYYFQNQQWVLPSSRISKNHVRIDYEDIPLDSEYRVSFDAILEEVYARYNRPMVVSETGSYGELRTLWWKKFLFETAKAIEKKIPIYGVCAYPVLDVPLGTTFILPQSGLWDFELNDNEFKRTPHDESLELISGFLKMA